MVNRWDVITIGNLSRNRYWGEDDEQAVREAICTTCLIAGEGFTLLVDPSLEDSDRMAAEIDRRAGLRLGNVDTVFVTHEHGDHHAGLRHFDGARWLAAPEVAAAINSSGKYGRDVEPVEGTLLDAIEVLHTPGHTPSHHSLLFRCDGLRVVVAGDAVMTRDFWIHRQGYFNSIDFDLASRTIEALSRSADVVVPGHDNCFLVSSAPFAD
jgi:glyoxylase-like metal-dependent hydrolase (beta-lactamase superfamily II)